ncbi:MAG: hypothetical protein ACTHMC_07950, partial [Pseudobacter sp.]|uniref:DUF6438 domain-containing protein n=1 Tax=Pseudobacter sp. TaxID=2045420 RepID=UPI003F7CDFCA
YNALHTIMKTFHLLVCLFVTLAAKANKIDELRTEKDIAAFVDSISGFTSSFPRNYLPNQLVFKYLKIDIDKNGSTDLLVNERLILAIVDNGNNQFVLKYIGSDQHERRLTGIDTSGPVLMLLVKKQHGYSKLNGPLFSDAQDTITYKFYGFIEYNSRPSVIDLENIKFFATHSYRGFHQFELTIRNDRSAKLHAKDYWNRNGVFQAVLAGELFDEFLQMINYIDPDKLKYDYAIEGSEMECIDIEIRYNGKMKPIHDYGMEGTLGLRQLYDLIEKNIKELQWQQM